MNAPLFPPEKFGPVIENASPFDVLLKFSADDIALFAPLWCNAFKTKFEVPAFGSVNLEVSDTLSHDADTLFLTVKVARHLFYISFSSAEWLNTLLKAFEDDMLLADFPQEATLALEAYFAGTLTDLEKKIGHDVTFLSLSDTAPYLGIENSPSAAFDVTFGKWGSACAFLTGADKAAHDLLVDLLTSTAQQPAPAPKTNQKITMNASLIADAYEIPYEQLRQIQPGEGFILGPAWTAQASYNLVVTDKVLATVNKADGVFTIDETFFVATPQTVPTPAPNRKARRMKRGRSNG